MRRVEKIHSPTLPIYFSQGSPASTGSQLHARELPRVAQMPARFRPFLASCPSQAGIGKHQHRGRGDRKVASASTNTVAAAGCSMSTRHLQCNMHGRGLSKTLAVMVVVLRARHLPTAALLIKNVLLLVPCGVRTGAFADGHTASNAPDLFRPPKLSGAGPG